MGTERAGFTSRWGSEFYFKAPAVAAAHLHAQAGRARFNMYMAAPRLQYY